jgi:hypothetical protein
MCLGLVLKKIPNVLFKALFDLRVGWIHFHKKITNTNKENVWLLGVCLSD